MVIIHTNFRCSIYSLFQMAWKLHVVSTCKLFACIELKLSCRESVHCYSVVSIVSLGYKRGCLGKPFKTVVLATL